MYLCLNPCVMNNMNKTQNATINCFNVLYNFSSNQYHLGKTNSHCLDLYRINSIHKRIEIRKKKTFSRKNSFFYFLNICYKTVICNLKVHPEAALAANLLSLSSEILNLIPLPLGNETYGLLPLPIINTLFNLKSKIKTMK